jgi:arsenate reductase-like glutaredoxin family protein
VLKKAAKQLGWEALINKKGPTWRKQPDDMKAAVTSDKSAFEFLQAAPSAIKRPLLEVNDAYHLGFSPELYAGLFKK